MEVPIETVEESNESINTCVVGITSSSPYDTSVFVNNSTTFYTTITYSELIKLYDLIDLATNETVLTQDNLTKPLKNKLANINMLYVLNCFKDPSIKMIFRFLCSPDCDDGQTFVDQETTIKIYDFVNLVTRRNCIIEVSDHSMGSFFKNWNDEYMDIQNPIEILPITHSGSFKMYGVKNDFINSTHPTLKQIGNLSSSEQIEIIFDNMGGTKVYKILDPNVKLISKGKQLNKNRCEFGFSFENTKNIEFPEINDEVPVHCEFNYQKGKIVISATHWCNLNSVETPVDLLTLRRYCTDSIGMEATINLEKTLSSAKNEYEYKRIISDTVREISSGISSKPLKKYKQNINESFENTKFDF
jgi:hypothetical protein